MKSDVETDNATSRLGTLLCLLPLLRSSASLLMLFPLSRLTLLAALQNLVAPTTLHHLLTFRKLILRLATSRTLASLSIDIVRGSIVLVVSQGNLELASGWAAEGGVEEDRVCFGETGILV
jgi:hypothetical protein